jgi:hypothetical protein
MRDFIVRTIAEIKKHSLSLLSSEPGSLSSGRLMMIVFAAFSLVTLTAIVWHCIHLQDSAQLHEWLSALPSIFSGCVALIGLPYGLSKAGSSISDIVGSLRKRD